MVFGVGGDGFYQVASPLFDKATSSEWPTTTETIWRFPRARRCCSRTAACTPRGGGEIVPKYRPLVGKYVPQNNFVL